MHARQKPNLTDTLIPVSNTMKHIQIIFVWTVIYSLVACRPFNSAVPEKATQMVVTQAAAPTLISTRIPDVVVNVRQFNRIVDLKLGQVLKVEPPSLNIEWQVDYAPALFEFITPAEMVRAPGTAGWLFLAVATGEGQIVLTSIVSCSQPPCSLVPMRFQLVVQVK